MNQPELMQPNARYYKSQFGDHRAACYCVNDDNMMLMENVNY